MKPSYLNSNWTGRTPRNMTEAFGCYEDSLQKEEGSGYAIKYWLGYVAVVCFFTTLVGVISGIALNL